ncbi:MAG: MCE family protein [Bacteroidetes bacterium]|nr:MCE family protein [Bacteroidota bacterium]
MKISKEIKTGFIALASIGLLVAGVNFLKGNSFFGGDDVYYVYFPNSSQLVSASSVTLNGVGVGKVLSVDYNPKGGFDEKVKVSFNIQNDKVRLPIGTRVQVGSLDLFNKGLVLFLGEDLSKGYHKPGDKLPGEISSDMVTQFKEYADPIAQKLQGMMVSIDKMVQGVSSFWDTSATSDLEGSMQELKGAIHKFGNVASEIESLVGAERVKFGRILNNVESITENLKLSNQQVSSIIGNTKKITDDLVTADFKGTVENAKQSLVSFNQLMEKANKGEGTLGKLISDDKLYNELNKTNQKIQNLVEDLNLHPERYINFSILGARSKGVNLNPSEERKLRKVLDSIPD